MKSFMFSHPKRFYCRKIGCIDNAVHTNFEIEIPIVTKGQLTMHINGKKTVLQKNQGVFVYPFETHDYYGDENLEYISVNFALDLIDLFFKYVGRGYTEERLFNVPDKIIEYLRYQENTNSESNNIFNDYNDSFILSILGPIFFCIKKDCTFTNKQVFENSFLLALKYINENLDRNISLSKIAKQIGVNPSYLSRTFSLNAKMNLTKYININRVVKASILLKTTNKTIIDISYEVGFNSIRTFNRLFLEYFNQTPSVFRNSN